MFISYHHTSRILLQTIFVYVDSMFMTMTPRKELWRQRSKDEQSRMTKEVMGRHDTARHEVSPIKERTYWWRKEVERKDPSGRLLPWEGLIQDGRRYNVYVIPRRFINLQLHFFKLYFLRCWNNVYHEMHGFIYGTPKVSLTLGCAIWTSHS